MEIYNAIFKGTKGVFGHLSVNENDRFKECCFEDISIDDSLATEKTFKHCYFENVEFSSKKHLTGVEKGNYIHPNPELN